MGVGRGTEYAQSDRSVARLASCLLAGSSSLVGFACLDCTVCEHHPAGSDWREGRAQYCCARSVGEGAGGYLPAGIRMKIRTSSIQSAERERDLKQETEQVPLWLKPRLVISVLGPLSPPDRTEQSHSLHRFIGGKS